MIISKQKRYRKVYTYSITFDNKKKKRTHPLFVAFLILQWDNKETEASFIIYYIEYNNNYFLFWFCILLGNPGCECLNIYNLRIIIYWYWSLKRVGVWKGIDNYCGNFRSIKTCCVVFLFLFIIFRLRKNILLCMSEHVTTRSCWVIHKYVDKWKWNQNSNNLIIWFDTTSYQNYQIFIINLRCTIVFGLYLTWITIS